MGDALGAGPRPSILTDAAIPAAVHAVFNSNAGHPATMPTQTPAERELAELLIASLNIEGITAADIDPDAPLFGAGLGLDSIDALELALAISKTYGFQLRSDSEDNKRVFASLRALSAYIEQQRTI